MSPRVFKMLLWMEQWLLSDEVMAHQARKPSGWIGKYLVQPMLVQGNAALNRFMLRCLGDTKTDTLLEIGFGPGVLLSLLNQQCVTGKIYGLDFSDAMLKAATRRNRKAIKAGRIELTEGRSERMPYACDFFDKVVTGNTLYFWQPPEPHLQEVLRVLKPGGKLVLGFRDKSQIDAMQLNALIFARYTNEEVEELLERAGFVEVRLERRLDTPLNSYAVIAYKPLVSLNVT